MRMIYGCYAVSNDPENTRDTKMDDSVHSQDISTSQIDLQRMKAVHVKPHI